MKSPIFSLQANGGHSTSQNNGGQALSKKYPYTVNHLKDTEYKFNFRKSMRIQSYSHFSLIVLRKGRLMVYFQGFSETDLIFLRYSKKKARIMETILPITKAKAIFGIFFGFIG